MATKLKHERSGRWFINFKGPDQKWHKKHIGNIKGWKSPITGKVTKKGLTEKEAEHIRKLYDAQELNRINDAAIRIVDLSVEQACNEFLNEELSKGTHVVKLAQGTKKNYKMHLNFLKRWFKENGIKKLSGLSVERANNFVHDFPGLPSGSLSNYQKLLFRFLRWSDKKGYWNNSKYLKSVRLVNESNDFPYYLPKEELIRFFEAVPVEYQNTIKFMYYVGARVGEIGFFKWSDIGNIDGKTTIRFSVYEGMKKKKPKTVFINSKAAAILEEQRKITGNNEYIFPNTRGNHLTGHYLGGDIIKTVFDKLNIDAGSHILRHTFASHLAIAGVSLLAIKELLRHENIRETMIYAKISNVVQQEAVEMLPV